MSRLRRTRRRELRDRWLTNPRPRTRPSLHQRRAKCRTKCERFGVELGVAQTGPVGRACRARPHRLGSLVGGSVIVEDRAGAAAPGEERIGAVIEQVQVEDLLRLLLLVPDDDNGDGLGRFAGGKEQSPGDRLVIFACLGSAVDGAAGRGFSPELRWCSSW